MRTWTFSQYISVVLLVAALWTSASCQIKRGSQNSILVIAVDQLGTDGVDCSKDFKSLSLKSGFEVLCRDFNRWTHAYTPSVLAVPAMTSLMTGQYPLSHGVHNNGNQYLAASFETSVEMAYRKGWSTAFISGGAPLIRKTGLSQGFEIFDDIIRPQPELLYRPFRQSLQIYSNQLKDLGRQESFTWIYVTDLMFANTPTRNSLGELRTLSFESQLEEFDENLAQLFDELKKIDRWNSTSIVVLGLNAKPKNIHPKINRQENLFSERTQVALFAKWANSESRQTFDQNVTLTDVGSTLMQIISGKASTSEVAAFPVQSLLTASESSDRWIPIESGWANWQRQEPIAWAFRRNAFLCVKQQKMKCFNSISDREESLPLAKIDLSTMDFNSSMQKLIDEPIKLNSESKKVEFNFHNHPCLILIQKGKFQPEDVKKCDDPNVLDLVQWMIEDQNPQADLSQKDQAKRKFVKTLWNHILDQKVVEMNKSLGFIWDISSEKMAAKKILDDVLDLNEVSKYRQQALRAISFFKEDVDKN